MIRRVEIVRLDPSASDSGMHIVLVTRTGGRAESLGPFASLWEACSVAGDLDDAEPIDAAALRHEVCTCAECSKPPDYLAADILSNRPTRRRGDTEPQVGSNVVTAHDGSAACDCVKCVRKDPARFHGNANGDPVQMRYAGRGGRTVHLTSRSCGTYAFCGADVGHGFSSASGSVDAICKVKFCKKCVSPDALAIAFGLIAFVAWARSAFVGVDRSDG